MKFAARIYASFFGLGFVPLAPGTAASLAAALLYKVVLSRWPWPLLAGFILIIALAGVPAASAYARELGLRDPRRIVIDEAAGQWAALFLAAPDWMSVATAFVLFRLFDVLKPFPIRSLERVPAGWGIMADDLAAAAYAWVGLRLVLLAKGAVL